MDRDILHRLGGLAALIVAGGVGWWGIWRPLEQARTHAPEISYDTKVFVLVPVALVFGLFFLIAGARWPYRDPESHRFTPAGWILFGLSALAAAGGFFLFKQQFEALGYVSG